MGTWKMHLMRAVRLLGSQPKLAEAMAKVGAENCSQSKISWLILHAKSISAEDALAIHRATAGKVSAHQLRPDLWATEAHVPNEPEPAAT